MIESFRDLEVYKKAFALSCDIHKASEAFPKTEQFGLTNQINRSSKSICAHLAEGFGKQRASKAEFKRFTSMALGSAHEVLVWIDYIIEFKYTEKERALNWRNEMEIIIKMLHALYSNI